MSVKERVFKLQLLKKPRDILSDQNDSESKKIKSIKECDTVYCIDCRAKMEYIGHKEWKCTKCHTVYKIESIAKEVEPVSRWVSINDAALIWASQGKDEDYMFGYTEEELEGAL